jgi:hypothetical protein
MDEFVYRCFTKKLKQICFGFLVGARTYLGSNFLIEDLQILLIIQFI